MKRSVLFVIWSLGCYHALPVIQGLKGFWEAASFIYQQPTSPTLSKLLPDCRGQDRATEGLQLHLVIVKINKIKHLNV